MASMCLNQKNNYQTHHPYNHMNTSNTANGNTTLVAEKQQNIKQKFQPLASAPTKILTNSNAHNIQPITTDYMVINKKRYSYGMLPYGLDQLPSVARRNARERNRVKQVNNGFANLRQHIPQTVITALSHGGRGASKKLSKVDTLRIAVEYIRGLQTLLESTTTHSSMSTSTTIVNNHASSDYTDDCSSDVNSFECSSINSLEDSLSQTIETSHSGLDITMASNKRLMDSVKLEESDDGDFKFNSFEQVDDEELLDYISTWQDE